MDLHGFGLERQFVEHELCGRRHPALLFRTHQLRLQGQVHAFGHDARRRFVEVLEGPEVGLLPLGGRFVASVGRVGDEGPQVARQPQAALQLRYGGQQQHTDRHGRPDAALRGRHGQQLHLRRSGLLDAQRQRGQRELHGQCQPDVGDDLFAQPGSRLRILAQPPFGIGRGVPEHHRGHSDALSGFGFGLQLPVPVRSATAVWRCRWPPFWPKRRSGA